MGYTIIALVDVKIIIIIIIYPSTGRVYTFFFLFSPLFLLLMTNLMKHEAYDNDKQKKKERKDMLAMKWGGNG